MTPANSALTFSKRKGAFDFLIGAKAKQYLKLVSAFQLIVLLMMQLGSKAYAQNTLDQLGLSAATPSLGAYSLRRLSTAYVGPAITVLRSSDLSVSNINFLPSGQLDTATLFSFIGSGNGTVQVWYDQSGFGRNLTQATASLQPLIVSSGQAQRDLNGNITLRFDGIDDHMTGTMSTGLLNVSLNMVARFTTGGNSEDLPFVIGQGGSARTLRAFFRSTNGPSLGYATWTNDAPTSAHRVLTDEEPHIFSALQNGTSITLSKNGANDIRTVPLAPLATTSALIQIGSISSNVAQYASGVSYSEALAFGSVLSASEKNIVECNQSAFYNIPLRPLGFEYFAQARSNESACLLATQFVTWRAADLVNMQATGNGVIKIQSDLNWNGGFASWDTVYNQGYLQFIARETNTFRMCGLSSTSLNSDFNTIQFAVYLQNNSTFNVYESGANRGGFGAYSVNDTFRVAIENNVVKYYRNSQLFYISNVAPSLPLIVDGSVYSINGTISDALVVNRSTGQFVAYPINGGASPTFQWQRNAASTASTQIYTEPIVSAGDLINVRYGFTSTCGTTNVNSRNISINSSPIPGVDITVASSVLTDGCFLIEQDVIWQPSSFANVDVSNGLITKVQFNNNWNGAGYSLSSVSNDGYLQFRATETNRDRMVGLSNTNLNTSFTSIQFAFFLVSNGALRIYESGVDRGQFSTFANGDILQIRVDGQIVKYIQNGNIIYVSTVSPTLPLFVDFSIEDTGGTIADVKTASFSNGTFTASLSSGIPSPSYQWFLNGSPTGLNSPTYNLPSLNIGDSVYVVVTPNLPGCGSSTISSGVSYVRNTLNATSIDFTISGQPVSFSCQLSEEPVIWQRNQLANVHADGNRLVKVQFNNNWNGGAYSSNRVSNEGYLQFIATETNRDRMVGLSNTNVNSSFNSIQYAFFLVNNGTLNIFETGINRGNFGTYATGDTLKILVEGNVIKYFRNGSIVYISTVPPTLPLFADVSIEDTGGTVDHLVLANYNTGTFSASVGAGVSGPTYQWFLNGSPVGTNSPTYANTALQNGDQIYAQLSPGLIGCGTRIYRSDTINYRDLPSPSTIDFFVTGVDTLSACLTLEEQVKWRLSDMVNVHADQNSLVKSNVNGWNGGAASWNTVKNNGYFEFTATETNRNRMAGLSNTNANANFTSIQYAIYLVNNATVQVFESGAARGTLTSYTSGDKFKVAVDAGQVKYLKNDTVFYISTLAPTLPLLVDVSLDQIGATITNAVVSNYNSGSFIAQSVNAGSLPQFTWRRNGVIVQTGTSNSYFNSSIVNGDVITCTLTPDTIGCSVSAIVSNALTARSIAAPSGIDFFIRGTATASACLTAEEQVRWRLADQVNVQATNNNLQKFTSNAWNGGAASWNTVSNNGYFQFIASETNRDRYAGLSTTNADAGNTSIRYAFYLVGNATLRIVELGADRGQFSTYATGDRLRIAVDAGQVKYLKNDTVLYISTLIPTLPLIVDVSLFQIGATITQAVVSNYNTGAFVATATNAGTNPSFVWRVNGSVVQSGLSNTYTNATLANNDTVTCTLLPDLGGCSSTTYLSNRVLNRFVPEPSGIDFFIRGTATASACLTAEEQVRWRLADQVNVQATNNNLQKFTTGGWNGGAASWNTVSNNGYFQFIASETNRERMAGLSTTNVDANFTSIRYAFYLVNNGTLRIYEQGADRGGFGTYSTGDTLRISYVNNEIRYSINSNILFISTLVPSPALIVDVSLNQIGGTITNAVVSNYNTGVFVANASSAGTNPIYLWKVNQDTLQSGTSPNFSFGGLDTNDTISCILVPDLGGCGNVSYPSNLIFNREVSVSASLDFHIESNSTSNCNLGIEQISWNTASLVSAVANGNNLQKFSNNGLWNSGAFSNNSLKTNGYLEFTVAETNTFRCIGLSSTNPNVNFNSVQFGFYLQNNATFFVMESGASRTATLPYLSGDVFRVSVESNVVRYYRNQVLIFTSALTPVLPLFADASLFNANATLSNVLLANFNNLSFQAIAVNAGASPSYQWRINGANSGTNSATFSPGTLAPNDVVSCVLSPNLGGCFVSTYSSNTIVYRAPGGSTTWNGSISNAWNEPANWSNGVPDRFTSAVIPSGTPNNPSVNVEASIFDLELRSGASLAVAGTNRMLIHRNFVDSGTFTSGTSTIVYAGCHASGGIFNSTGTETFFNFQLNSTNQLTLQSGTYRISGAGTFTRGILNQNASLVFLAGSSTSGASALSYVNGQVTKEGNTAFVFPTGSANRLGRIAIGAPTAVSTFRAQYFDSPFSSFALATSPAPTLNNVSSIEHWILDRIAGTGNATVTLHWENAQFSQVLNCTNADLRVARFNGTAWENANNTVVTTGACTGTSAGTIRTNTAVTAFSPFTFGSLTTVLNPLPVEFADFNCRINETGQPVLNWIVAAEKNAKTYFVQRSADGINFKTIGTVLATPSFEGTKSYGFTDGSAPSGLNYYRVAHEDQLGEWQYSSICAQQKEQELKFYPNPASKVLNLSLPYANGGEVYLLNVQGEKVRTKSIANETDINWQIGDLSSGFYTLIYADRQGIIAKEKVIILAP